MKMRILPIIIFALITVSYYWYQANGNFIPFAADPAGSDLLAVNVPYLSYTIERQRQWSVPLWTSRVGGGFPQFAEGGTAFFYPVVMLLGSILPPLYAILLLFPLHAFLAMVGMYLLARVIGIGRWGGLLAGIVFAFNGYFVGHVKHLTHLFMAATLLPFAVACVIKFFQTKKPLWAVGTGLVPALMVLSGSAFVAYQTILLLILFSLAIITHGLITTACRGRANKVTSHERIREYKEWLKTCFILLLAAGFTFFALSAVQLIPTYQLTQYASRETKGLFGWASAFPFHPHNFVTFVSPFARGNPAYNTYNYAWDEITYRVGLFWENIGYVGLVPLLLALTAIPLAVRRRSWLIGSFVIVLIVGTCLVLGPFLPFYQWFWKYVPFFSSFRVPGRYLLWTVLSLSALAGLAFDALMAKFASFTKVKFSPLTLSVIGTGVLAVTLFDLGAFNFHYNTMNTLAVQDWRIIPRAVAFLRSHPGTRMASQFAGQDFERGMMESGGWQHGVSWVLDNRELLPPDYSLLYDIDSIDHYTPLSLSNSDAYRTEAFKQWIASVSRQAGDPSPRYQLRDHALALIKKANVHFLLSYERLVSSDLQEAAAFTSPHSTRTLRVYEVSDALPRAYFARVVEHASNRNEAKELLPKLAEFHHSAIIESNDMNPIPTGEGEITTVLQKDGYFQFNTQVLEPSIMVLSEALYPGWEAYIDRVPTRIFPANLAFQSVIVPSGSHTVEFVFRSRAFLIGSIISLIGWSCFLGGVLYLLMKRIKGVRASMR